MRNRNSPAFLFYVDDWRASRRVQKMTFAERGMYVEMFCEQWGVGWVPGTPEECAALLGGTEEEWRCAWPKLLPNFRMRKAQVNSGSHPRLVNPKMATVRRERLQFLRKQRASGTRGAASRWHKGQP